MMERPSTVRFGTSGLSARPEGVPTPNYDRNRLSVGIVHFGVGGFHRAHQAMYIDRLMNAGEAFDWAICGVGVLEADRRMRDALIAQACLYTLVEKHNDGVHTPRVIGSIIDYLYAPDDPRAVIERLADETTRVVSLTVTEGGYSIDDASGEFMPGSPELAGDLEPGAVPRTFFGLITEALARRRKQGSPPFTVVSCDNLPGNGRLARTAFTAFARLRDPELGAWVEQEVRFPNSMVDRITPATTDADREQLSARFGIEDRWPVVCEPFVQWVLEDSFSCSRPRYEQADVQLVDDVEPYELMKLRLLNGSHQGLCYFARLCGYELVHEAARDPLFRRFLRGYMDREATGSTLRSTNAPSSNASPTPRSATRSRDSAPRAPTGSPSSCCRSSASSSPATASSRIPPRSLPAGRATPRGLTSRASRSTSWIASANASWASPRVNTRIRWPSSRTASCSGI